MGNSSHKGVQEAFREVVYKFGVEKLADMMGKSPGVLYNKCNLNDNESYHNKPLLAEGVLVTNLTGNMLIVKEMCRATGMVAMELPILSNLSTDALMMHLIRLEEEGGEFYRSLHGALKSNNDITQKGFTQIEREAHEWIAAILESLARMKEMSRG
jgi:hypothetical protein